MKIDETTTRKRVQYEDTDIQTIIIDEEIDDTQRSTNFKTYVEPRIRLGVTF